MCRTWYENGTDESLLLYYCTKYALHILQLHFVNDNYHIVTLYLSTSYKVLALRLDSDDECTSFSLVPLLNLNARLVVLFNTSKHVSNGTT